MAKYAMYEMNDSSKTIVGWFDADSRRYNQLPPIANSAPENYIIVSQDIWDEHIKDLRIDHWHVINGKVTYTPT